MINVKKGDVLHILELREQYAVSFRDVQVWVVSEGADDMPHTRVLVGYDELVRTNWLGVDDGTRLTLDLSKDTIVIPDPSEWPDEVCAAMAKRALLSEANK